jgi:hypothetical protein
MDIAGHRERSISPALRQVAKRNTEILAATTGRLAGGSCPTFGGGRACRRIGGAGDVGKAPLLSLDRRGAETVLELIVGRVDRRGTCRYRTGAVSVDARLSQGADELRRAKIRLTLPVDAVLTAGATGLSALRLTLRTEAIPVAAYHVVVAAIPATAAMQRVSLQIAALFATFLFAALALFLAPLLPGLHLGQRRFAKHAAKRESGQGAANAAPGRAREERSQEIIETSSIHCIDPQYTREERFTITAGLLTRNQ